MSDVSAGAGRLDLSAVDLDLLAQLVDGDGAARSSGPADVTRPASLPASFSQELLWLLDHANPGMTAYNMPIARRVRGTVDLGALQRALDFVVARHETLRTRFVSADGEVTQVIDPQQLLPIRLVDLRAVAKGEREAAAAAMTSERARVPFDLAAEPAFRVTVIRLEDDDAVLLIETHHIVFDGWSAGVLFDDLSRAYEALRGGNEPALPTLPFHFADYAIWQRNELAGERLTALVDYWRGQLGESPDPLGLPTDFPRPEVPGFAGARRRRVVDAARFAGIREFAQRNGATLYMTLLAAYMAVLHRYTDRETILVGSGVAARTDSDTERLIGYFNNTLVMRGDFVGDPSFAELLRRVRESCLAAYDHQDVPLEKLVLELRRGDDRTSTAPLFEVVFTMQNTLATSTRLGEAALEPFGADLGATKFDVTLLATERDGELGLVAQYRTDLFAPDTMDRFLGHICSVLEAATANQSTRVSEIDLVDAMDAERMAGWGRGALLPSDGTSLLDLLEKHATRSPDRAAVAGSDEAVTYAVLERRANQLAHQLIANGVRAGQPVGLALDRSCAAIVALIAIWKAGGAYVPIPSSLPATVAAARLADAGARVVIADDASEWSDDVTVVRPGADSPRIGARRETSPGVTPSPDALAYVLYTSGSTGVPKGVGVTHANVLHYTRAISRVLADVPEGAPGDGLRTLSDWHFGLVSSLGADLGNTCLFPALAAGATLHVLDEDTATSAERFVSYASSNPLDAVKITPSHLRALRSAGQTGALPRRWLVLGGEPLGFEFALNLLGAPERECRVLNHYGPTETTVGATTFEVTRESLESSRTAGAATVPIGRPLGGVRVAVRDARGRLRPVGVPGELFIGGAGVTSGYVGRPSLTNERFVADEQNRREYRTGDRVRWLRDSATLEFLGRLDDQVKVRGYRVELGEIEYALAAHARVADCAVALSDEGEDATARLVAYVALRESSGYAVAHRDGALVDELQAWLAERLPPYMVPSTIVRVERIPRTASGKIDRRALPRVADDQRAAAVEMPTNDTESAISAIWCDVLRRDAIGVTQNFVELGGHSLLAIRVLGRLSKQFGVRLPLRTLFDAPTVRQLAIIVDAERTSAAPAAPISARARDSHRINISATSADRPAGGSDGGKS